MGVIRTTTQVCDFCEGEIDGPSYRGELQLRRQGKTGPLKHFQLTLHQACSDKLCGNAQRTKQKAQR